MVSSVFFASECCFMGQILSPFGKLYTFLSSCSSGYNNNYYSFFFFFFSIKILTKNVLMKTNIKNRLFLSLGFQFGVF